jgi:hypothetical protein
MSWTWPIRRMARDMDDRWPDCQALGKAGRKTLRCEAPKGHSGSHVGTLKGNHVYWGRELHP